MKKLSAYLEFWNKINIAPLISHSFGNYFVSKRYKASEKLLRENRKIEPKDIKIDEFRSDYLRQYKEWEEVNSETVFTGVPFTGIPWIEAMLGCDVYSAGSSFIADCQDKDMEKINIERLFNREWLDLFLDFTEMLRELGRDRFPVGQPILRGPTDVAGTILGQDELVYSFFDNPCDTAKLLSDFADFLLYVIAEQKKHIDSFEGGFSMGFYDLWCPGDCIWFQDDLTALLSPGIYEKYIYDIHKRISESYEYSMIHLHPASFFILDFLLDIKELKAIQINKDKGGPPLEEMIPQLSKVKQAKNLIVWGDFTTEEFHLMRDQLSP